MEFKNRIKEMYGMLEKGQMMDAFEKYYHEDVRMIEATGEVREGKAVNREFQNNWKNSIEQQHGGGVTAFTSDEENQVTMVETWTDVTFKGGQRAKLEEIARQQWKDGQIVEERFYYDTKGMG